MTILRYFGRVYAGALVLTLLGLSVLVVAVQLVERAGDLARSEGGASTAARLALFGAVEYAYQVLPVACFLALLIAGTILARRGEFMAVQAAGLSAWSMGRPFVMVCVVAVLGGLVAGETLVPWALRGTERVRRDELRQVDALTRFYNRRTQWFREGDLILFLPAVDRTTGVFDDPTVYQLEHGQIRAVLEAEALVYEDESWWLRTVETRSMRTAQVHLQERLALPLEVAPQDLADVTGNPRQLSSVEVRALIARRAQAGFDTTAHQVEYFQRFAFPVSGLWLLLMAAPWVLQPGRRRSLAMALGSGVVVIALFLALTQVFRLLALGHKISPMLGAFGPGAVCLLLLPVSVYGLARLQRRGRLV